jgi:hypothetical protein
MQTKISSFRLRSEVISQLDYLSRELNTNRTDIIDQAISSYAKKIMQKKLSHPLNSVIGSIDTLDGEQIINAISKNKTEQIQLSTGRDQKLEKLFE